MLLAITQRMHQILRMRTYYYIDNRHICSVPGFEKETDNQSGDNVI
jgi:hypothetical protein